MWLGMTSFVIAREPRSPRMILIVANGDTFDIDFDTLRMRMKLKGMTEAFIEDTLDYVWNFYGGRVHQWDGEWRMEPLTFDQAAQFASRPLVSDAVVLT